MIDLDEEVRGGSNRNEKSLVYDNCDMLSASALSEESLEVRVGCSICLC